MLNSFIAVLLAQATVAAPSFEKNWRPDLSGTLLKKAREMCPRLYDRCNILFSHNTQRGHKNAVFLNLESIKEWPIENVFGVVPVASHAAMYSAVNVTYAYGLPDALGCTNPFVVEGCAKTQIFLPDKTLPTGKLINGSAMFISNCVRWRLDKINEIRKFFRIDVFGGCGIAKHAGRFDNDAKTSKRSVSIQYTHVVVMENRQVPESGYATEKLYEALTYHRPIFYYGPDLENTMLANYVCNFRTHGFKHCMANPPPVISKPDLYKLYTLSVTNSLITGKFICQACSLACVSDNAWCTKANTRKPAVHLTTHGTHETPHTNHVSHLFDRVTVYTSHNQLSNGFRETFANVLTHSSPKHRYWAWKLGMIEKEMRELRAGDILVHVDASITFCEEGATKLAHYVRTLRESKHDALKITASILMFKRGLHFHTMFAGMLHLLAQTPMLLNDNYMHNHNAIVLDENDGAFFKSPGTPCASQP